MSLLAQANTINLTNPLSPYRGLFNLKPSDLVTSSITLILGAAGVTSFIYVLIGGYQWITSSGDKEGLEKAKKRIMHALIGLAIVFSAYALIRVVQILFNINTISVNISPI